MSVKTIISRSLYCTLTAALTAHAGAAAAIDFNVFGTPVTVDSLLTIGASWRMQDRDPSLIGKSTLYRLNNPDSTTGLCVSRTGDDGVSGPNPNPTQNSYTGDTCTTSGTGQPNRRFVAAPGSFSPNGDNGNLNFDKGDIVHAIAKLTTDISFSVADFNVFVRPIYFFDANYSDDFQEVHPDTTLQASTSPLPEAVEDMVGSSLDVLDYHISTVFDVFDRGVSIKLGNQVLNWGESSFLALNSLNTINPPDARRLNMPGLDLKEAFQPVGMLVMGTDLFENASIETFYQYDWRPLIVDPVGSFFSQSDTLGAGGRYAMLSFAKSPEDPNNLYQPRQNSQDPIGALGSTAGRTIYRDFAEEKARRPNDGGQYGAALKLFLEDFNNGTELAFYAANYHSRLPVVSAIAAQATCLVGGSPTSVTNPPPAGCGVNPVARTAMEEPIPVDTAALIVEYPENIKLYGLSFNTTIGDYALSGEYAFRENLPIQIHSVDLTYAALQPAFPDADINLGATTIPGRQSAFPSFLTRYRGLPCGQGQACIEPGQYIRGYEDMKVGQANLTVLRLIGGDNPLAASQMTFLLEMGMTQVFDMPGLDKLQFQGAGTDTHISGGADGTQGIEPPRVPGNSRANNLRQNPTAHKDLDGFGAAESYGYRLLNLTRWDSALFGANLETLALIRHDVKGTTPGIGGNFVQGRKQFNLGLRFDYLATWVGEVRYTWFTGGANRDGQRDRDNIFVTLGYQF